MGQKQLVTEDRIREEVIKALQDYRVLRVKFHNQQERAALGAELLFPELRSQGNDKKYIRYIQIKRALEEALDEDERKILEMKYMNTRILNDDYIYTVIGIKRATFYRKKKSAINNFADAINII
ncbi:ArpU family transcriptional regulator [Bacillus cereus]|uniref:ArpU family phage packaging/lysis transcriptional regulator n=1 Tax=Bacillus cereus group TaxID=86661 RepID=UPI000BF9E1E9|nr:ArpU family phage packaging/lysis transcriptional regulator [Bacillus cereus]PEQ75168.1 ArpU family transcriptional regulator [Bacillus cereus]PFS27797.1 ArpU family transcriptional regulator [Bacillus cereus]